MKKILITLIVFISFNFNYSQEREWYLTAGINMVNSLGSQNPFESPGDWAFGNPFAVSVEYRGPENFAIEQTISFNKFDEGTILDSAILLDRDYTYFAADISFKYYFGQHIFGDRSQSDLYVNLGGTYFSISEDNMAGHLGLGYMYWLNEDRTFALRTQIVGKLALNNSSSGLTTNHYQYFLQVLYRFK